MSDPCDKLITDALGFPLRVNLELGDYNFQGQHSTYENAETGKVDQLTEHTIKIKRGQSAQELAETASHECYHLFYSVRHLITVDEEMEATVFGQLAKRVFDFAADAMPTDELVDGALGDVKLSCNYADGVAGGCNSMASYEIIESAILKARARNE